MSLIWATRGRTWGFRFVRHARLADPLPVYETAFSGIETSPEVFRRLDNIVAVRLRDPESRKDQSGRIIFHDFVLEGTASSAVDSTQDARENIWPLVVDEYDRIYGSPTPPRSHA